MGDKVLLSTKYLNTTGDRKMVPCFVEPFSIISRVRPLAYQMSLGTCYSQLYPIFHISLPKSFRAGGDGYLHPTAVYVEDEQEWEVSGILQHKGSGAKRKYLVDYAIYDKSKA